MNIPRQSQPDDSTQRISVRHAPSALPDTKLFPHKE
jgi:hypothetical protein